MYLWDVSMMVVPALRAAARVFQTYLLASGSTPVVGSSRKTTVGFPINATATHNLRLFPQLQTTYIIYIEFYSVLPI